MDNAHLDFQSQNYFCINSSESKIDWSDVYKIKIILFQPSPNWKTFHIENIKIFQIIHLQTHDNIMDITRNLQFKIENPHLYKEEYIC